MVLDHIGIVVKSIESALEQWKNVFGYEQMTTVVLNTRQKVKVVFLRKTNSLPVKLIEPSDPTSPIYAQAQRGGGLHHLCFQCENLNEQLLQMQQHGLRILAPPQPGEAFDNEPIAFVYANNGLNVELIDTDKRAGKLP